LLYIKALVAGPEEYFVEFYKKGLRKCKIIWFLVFD